MIQECRLIYPYYDNPAMLEMQVNNWNRIAGELRGKIRIVLIDDASPNHPALPIIKDCKAPKMLFRVNQNIPWNQHGARNLGARVACKDYENYWLYMSDIDIMITPETLYTLLSKELDVGKHHTFERVFAPDMTEKKYHCNTFLVKRNMFWQINGYDEDYCGTYGGDGPFLRQLEAIAPRQHHDDITLIGYKETVVADANTRQWSRKDGEFGQAYREIFDKKRKTGDERSQKPIRFKWERQI